MRDAPERIWADRQRISKWVEGTWTDIEPGDPLYAEYLRVDSAAARVEALQAEVERLREENASLAMFQCVSGYGDEYGNSRCAVQDDNAHLQADLAVAREALEPFGRYLDANPFDLDNHGNPVPDDQGCGWVYLTAGQFRRARAALARITQEAPE